jgi:hypothetical protein
MVRPWGGCVLAVMLQQAVAASMEWTLDPESPEEAARRELLQPSFINDAFLLDAFQAPVRASFRCRVVGVYRFPPRGVLVLSFLPSPPPEVHIQTRVPHGSRVAYCYVTCGAVAVIRPSPLETRNPVHLYRESLRR